MALPPMKTNASNSFEAGMITDIHPLRADNKSLTYGKNIEFVAAASGSQLILQKRDGNQFVTNISNGFKPVAVAELDNILYIISFNSDSSTGEIGTFPSPKYSGTTLGVVDMEYNYKPLNNFHDGSGSFLDANFFNSFTTPNLYFAEGDFVDINLSKSYDSSVNIIITDSVNPIRLINTRFSVLSGGNKADLIKHRTGNGTNSYSDFYFAQTELIPTSISIPKLTFNGLNDGGTLAAGGYRYFFKYIKDDGAQTDIIEESRLVSVHPGASEVTSFGLDGLKTTSKSVKFTLTNLDDSYYGIKVYFTVASGDADFVATAFALTNPFKIVDGRCVILHTGFETVTSFNKESIGVKYSSISKGKSLTVSNDRLIVANSEESYTTDAVLESLANGLEISEGVFDIYHDNTGSTAGLSAANSAKNYANSDFSYNSTGFWKGETYELGVVYITENGLSPVYPLKGMDRLDGAFDGTLGPDLRPYPVLPIDGSVFGDYGVNKKGVYRTASNGPIWNIMGSDIIFKGTKLTVDIQTLLDIVPYESTIDGYLQSAEATIGITVNPWRVFYNIDANEYFIRGSVTTEFGSTVPCINLNDSSIPLPKVNIRFGSIEIHTDGTVVDYGTKAGTNLTSLYGPAVDAKSASKGFFIVRKKRIKDKLLEGLVMPTAAFPTESRGVDGNTSCTVEFAFPSNWTGCGLNSIKKSNVVLAPTPSLCVPYGTASLTTPSDASLMSNYISGTGATVDVAATILVDATLPKYVGVLTPKVVVPLSYVDTNITAILFEGVAVQTAYATTGMPVLESDIDLNNKTVAIPISYFKSTVDKIVKGTRVLSYQKVEGGGKSAASDIIVRAPICDYNDLKGWAIYSPDTECNPEYHSSIIHNSFSIAIPASNIAGNVQYLTNPDSFNESLPFHTRLSGSFWLNNATSKLYSGQIDYVGDEALATGSKAFTGILDRVIYAWYFHWPIGSTSLTKLKQKKAINGVDIDKNNDNAFRGEIFLPGVNSGFVAKQYWDDNGSSLGVCVKYGRYLGMKIDSYVSTDVPLKNLSPTADIQYDAPQSADSAYRNVNYSSSIKGFSTGFNDTSSFGAYCQVFSARDANGHRSLEAWKSIYDDDSDTEYVAISRRYDYNEFGLTGLDSTIDLFGGDCFLGLSWKQVWYPRGIQEAPQVTDLAVFAEGRRNLGMLNYGYVIPVPAQSNYNFNIRSKDRSAPGEFAAFGRDRSFIPARPLASSRGNRLLDTGKMNKGYNAQDVSDNKFFKLSDSAPYYKELFPNRVYASESFRESNFVNGFTIFKGLNYKDYNSELGPIYRLITLSDKLYSIFRDGIGIIGVGERTQVSTDTGGVYIDNADVLSQKASIISTGYGSDQPRSVVSTNNFIYGVDWNRVKIWRTNGSAPEIISDTRVQDILADIQTSMLAVGSDAIFTIYSTYDPSKGDISFTFVAKDPADANNYAIRTLVFNELQQLNCWVCEAEDHRNFFARSNDRRMSFTPLPTLRPDSTKKESAIYSYDNDVTYGGNNILYDVQVESTIRYSVVDDTGAFKIFENIWIAGDNPIPDVVKYLGDSNSDNGAWVEQPLKPYTNVAYYMKHLVGNSYVQCTGTMLSGSKTLTLSALPTMTPPGRTSVLLPADYISLEQGGVVYRFTVISVAGTIVTVDKPAVANLTGWNVVYGYKTPVWLSDSSIEEGYGKITCMSGVAFKNKPRSKWMKFEMTFKGEDQMYIGAIVTTYSKSYS